MNRIKRWIYQKTFNASDRMEIYDNFRQYLLDGLSAQITFEKLSYISMRSEALNVF
ncbi:hypothetical protein L243_14905 [Salmonella enterica subsp. enterica serovar Worthington str. BCH-3008]|nr:hypothetical protein L243_14905 [Salmonella enterica subsp. enterica serovar Worthington str. BCH-3008]